MTPLTLAGVWRKRLFEPTNDRYDFPSLNGSGHHPFRYEPPRPKQGLRRCYDDFSIPPSQTNGFSRDDRRHQTLRPSKTYQTYQNQQQTYSPVVKNHPIYQTNVPVKARPVQQQQERQRHYQQEQQQYSPSPKLYHEPQVVKEQVYKSDVKEHIIHRSKSPCPQSLQSPQRKQEPLYQNEYQQQQGQETYFPLKHNVNYHQKSAHDQQYQQYQVPIQQQQTYSPKIKQEQQQFQQHSYQQQQQTVQPQSILRKTKSSSALNTSSSRPGSPQPVAGAGDIINTEHGFTIQLDVRHFRPDDIKVNLTGNTLTVTGDRIEEDRCSDQALRRQFSRKYAIPGDIVLVSIKSHMTDDGYLFVRGNRKGWKETNIGIQQADDETYRRKYRKTTMSSKSSVISNV
ncbi:hypothetical protein L596_017268 [Steinernema carpocapsae]|uniref:SHSP domain-containing protein n=1 Tax=Steinernema carpocapsae TaxID=34508 RepID=A0A4U5N161_STECR|nr:hypothetical protein L596_017268 [Steinernema carpocapsae]